MPPFHSLLSITYTQLPGSFLFTFNCLQYIPPTFQHVELDLQLLLSRNTRTVLGTRPNPGHLSQHALQRDVASLQNQSLQSLVQAELASSQISLLLGSMVPIPMHWLCHMLLMQHLLRRICQQSAQTF
jgi:hypothetical protein